MLDTTECQKPRRRLNFPGLRTSKFRHVYGLPAKKEKCYENIRISRNAQEGQYCAVNPKFLAVVVEVGGGGSFIVLPLSSTGRVDHHIWKVTGHAGPVLDIKWNPFDDCQIASASEDCKVRLWNVPEGGLKTDLKECSVELLGHRRKVGLLEWHPTASDILVSAGHDHRIIVWNVISGEPVNIIEHHTDTIFSMSFNGIGSLLATTCKDKKLRILDPRSGKLINEGKCHPGTKASKVVYLGSSGRLFTTGFSKFSDRQYGIWSEENLQQPLMTETIDSSSGILSPYFDQDTGMVYVVGKGDGNVRYYEILDEAPWVCYLNQFISGAPQKSFGLLPKRGVDVTACEVLRFYKLHATKDVVEPISMIVPRKSSMFQEDIYPDTSAPVAALTADAWLEGRNALPVLMSMKTQGKLDMKRKTEDRKQQLTPILDNNNDKKFLFLAEQTNPDYRPVKEANNLQPQSQYRNTSSSADITKTKENDKVSGSHMNSTARRKELKTSFNLETKLHNNKQNLHLESENFSDLQVYLKKDYKSLSELGSHSVKQLTSKFDGRVENEEQISDVDLMRMIKEQSKLISNLKDQVEIKEKRIEELETALRILLKEIPSENVHSSLNHIQGV